MEASGVRIHGVKCMFAFTHSRLACVVMATVVFLYTFSPRTRFQDRGTSKGGSGVEEEFVSCQGRSEWIQNACTKNDWTDPNSTEVSPNYFRRLLADDKHQIIYCVIPKAGCSSVKYLMASATGNVDDRQTVRVHSAKYLRTLGLRYLSGYKMTSIRARLRAYKKFIVVRHPFDRLQSAFDEKFRKGAYYPRRNAALINATFKDVVWDREKGVPRINIEQFLELIAGEYGSHFRDIHWLSYYDLCHPCDIQYDEVIKLETIGSDIGTVLTWLRGPSEELTRKNERRESNAKSKLNEVSHIFKKIKPNVVDRLLGIYRKDFELFNYSWDHETGAQCSNRLPGGQACC